MLQWDYKAVVLTHRFMGWHRDELNRARFELALDELGRQGFELTWVFPNQRLQREKDGHLLIFKRPVEADTTTPAVSPVSEGDAAAVAESAPAAG
jgi:hypothetical protein